MLIKKIFYRDELIKELENQKTLKIIFISFLFLFLGFETYFRISGLLNHSNFFYDKAALDREVFSDYVGLIMLVFSFVFLSFKFNIRNFFNYILVTLPYLYFRTYVTYLVIIIPYLGIIIFMGFNWKSFISTFITTSLFYLIYLLNFIKLTNYYLKKNLIKAHDA